jgi:putative tricarboxylic transport membrane protein
MTKERGGGLIFLLLGIYGLIFSSPLSLGEWNDPGPGVLPLSLSILLCVSGISWFFAGKPKGGEKTGIDWNGMARLLKTPFQIVVVTSAFVLAMPRIGYLAGSFLYLFLILFLVSRYKLRAAAGLAIVLGIGSWLFFVRILVIQLPTAGAWIF